MDTTRILSSVPIAALEQLFGQVADIAFFVKDSQYRILREG